jgi:hypothetical protein
MSDDGKLPAIFAERRAAQTASLAQNGKTVETPSHEKWAKLGNVTAALMSNGKVFLEAGAIYLDVNKSSVLEDQSGLMCNSDAVAGKINKAVQAVFDKGGLDAAAVDQLTKFAKDTQAELQGLPNKSCSVRSGRRG